MLFAIVTFSLLWATNRYNVLYVVQSKRDTGGLLYPTAINQTFTGLYVMELCLIGLFFLVEDETGKPACLPHALIMIVALLLTAPYQILLNMGFSPLITHLATIPHDSSSSYIDSLAVQIPNAGCEEQGSSGWEDACSGVRYFSTDSASAEADQKGKTITPESIRGNSEMLIVRDSARDTLSKDREAAGTGLEEDTFQHHALKKRYPVLWLPRDKLGISNCEVETTAKYANKTIKITNSGASLDDRLRVICTLVPPDLEQG
jgi:hypothetical protein